MAITYAVLKNGNPIVCDYVAGSAISAGDVIVTTATPRIAQEDIANGAKGALACSGGIYLMPKATAGSSASPDDTLVYWDATNHVITTTSSGNERLGYTVAASVDGAATAPNQSRSLGNARFAETQSMTNAANVTTNRYTDCPDNNPDNS